MIARSPLSVTSGTSTGAATAPTSTSSTATYEADSGPGIINLLTITGEEQVALKVQVVEVQRSVVKQLGINPTTLLNGSNFVFQTLTGVGASPINFPFTPSTPLNPGGFSTTYNGDNFDVGATLRALEETRMLRTIAEPTLTAVSGETADFLAGGEFPVPVTGDNGQLSIEFKQFGVNLAFTPVVLSAGRISLKVRSEVSELSTNGAVSVPIGIGQSVTIPATSVRRAETTVELPSGGAFVMAGLVQESTRRSVSGLPWLQKLPVLGMLFSSKDFLSDQTELVMVVTPYLVKPASPNALTTPGENFLATSDAEAYFLNRLTKVYGTEDQVPGGATAQVGFTFD
jgi:pilus assembly protein CpaC